MKIKENDFLKIDYTVKSLGKIIDTTIEKVAKENNIFDEKVKYEPKLAIAGKLGPVKGVYEALIGKEVGETFKIEVPPEKAYGKRNPKLIKLIPLRVFKKKGIIPYVGMIVNIDGLLGTIRSVSGGRVIVNFNHPLAGKTLEYEVSIKEIIESNSEKLKISYTFIILLLKK